MKKGNRPSVLDQPQRESNSPLQSPTSELARAAQSQSPQRVRPPLSLPRRNVVARRSSGPASPQSPRRTSVHSDGALRSNSKGTILPFTERRANDGALDADGIALPGAEQSAKDPAFTPSPMNRSYKRLSTSGDSESTLREMEAAFASPGESGLQTASTQSTESNKTVRATPAGQPREQAPLRTPSYPFPYVSSGPSSRWSTPLHQPFTTLSPISSNEEERGGSRMRERFLSNAGTFDTQGSSFAPNRSDQMKQGDDPLSPTPDLYDLVLQLNAEPNLESWWPRLTTIMREQYKVHRLSLAIPTDTTDIENVPWGQRATYNAFGLQMAWSHTPSASGASWGSSSSASRTSEAADQAARFSKSFTSERPSISRSRSYAVGDEGPVSLASGDSPKQTRRVTRPVAPRSMTSHLPSSILRSGDLAYRVEDGPAFPSTWQSADREDLEESRDGQSEKSLTVHSRVQPLDLENDALLEPASVNRVLERGSMVLLIRDFSVNETSQRSGKQRADDTESPQPFSVAHHKTQRLKDRVEQQPLTKYEDHEQLPTNPWSQSPAPSPAMQHETEENPFFPSGAVNEDSFEPTPMNEPDYGRGFEAIGVDRASTIIHIPLIHPLLSRSLPAVMVAERRNSQVDPQSGASENVAQPAELARKAPIAILSLMSDVVPYPRNWSHSIDLLGPHLATSFQTCYQNSLIQERIDRALRGNQRLKHIADIPLEGIDAFSLGAGLDSLLQYDDDGNSSTIGSLTSPSEAQSTHSGQSPPDSLTSTPAPLVPDSPSSYFDVKKRMSLERSRSSGIVPPSPLPGPATTVRAPSTDHRAVLRKLDVGSSSNRDEKRTHGKRDQSSKAHEQSSSRTVASKVGKQVQSQSEEEAIRRDTGFSILHSNGADFKTSFPSLPMTATPKPFSSLGSRTAFPTSPLDNSHVAPSDRLLRILIDALPVQVFIAHPDEGHLTWVNSKFLAYGGLTASEVYTKRPWETVHPDNAEECRELWAKHLRTGQQFQHKTRLRRFDGAYRHHYVRAAPLRSLDQRIVHWVGTITDFHDQHVAETNASKQQETAQSEAKYRALANSSPQIVFAAKRHRGIIFCNSQWQAYSAQTEEESRGLGFMECVHPEDLPKCNLPDFDDDDERPSNVPISVPSQPRRTRSSATSSELSETSGDTILGNAAVTSPVNMQMPQRKLSELATQGILKASKDATGKKSYSTEVRLRMATGEYRWHLVRVLLAEPLIQAEFSDESDETWYGTCTDINDHKELERTLKDTMDAKSRFLSNMSHEIRTPLNGIWGMTNFLIDSSLTVEQADHVNVIRASTEGLRDLINDILDLSKVEAGMIKLNIEWFHIRSVIEEVNDLLSTMALEKGLELNYLVDRDVNSMMKGDRFRLRQVLLNLIGNAIKFTNQGEVFVRCQKLPSMPEDRKTDSNLVQVDIMDTGRGFSDKEADMLFKRFSQIDGSSTRQHGGTGLGLVISMQLVELHGGTMSASSNVGKGSCFTFTMRFGLPTENDPPPQKPISEPELAVGHSKSQATDIGPSDSQLDARSPGERAKRIMTEREMTDSPTQTPTQDKSAPSSAGSMLSTRSLISGSTRSSQSSVSSADAKSMRLEIKPVARPAQATPSDGSGKVPVAVIPPLLYSILVVSPLPWSRDAAVGHLDGVMDGEIPYTVTARATIEEVGILTEGDDPLNFTHIVIIMKDTDMALKLTRQMFRVQSSSTSVVLVSDLEQKKNILDWTESHRLEPYLKSRRLQFVQKPMKPSRLALIFDPSKQRELSTDVNQSSAQQIAATQKQVLDDMARRLGGRGVKVLLVEDNKVNQMVMLKLLQRVSVSVDTVLDGLQATDQVFKKPVGYYSIILMDLMMPNKDGYESCRDIRTWERENKYKPLPIVALSANVLDDVWRKCKDAGFNSYLTKPLQFTELSEVMTDILDPDDPNQPLMTMRGKGAPVLPSPSSGRR